MKGNIREAFLNYLIDRGYAVYTPKGLPSTVFNYVNRIDSVISWENFSSWYQVVINIKELLVHYDIGGTMEEYGLIGHSSVINALRRFDEFCEELYLVKEQIMEPFLKGEKISSKLIVGSDSSTVRLGDTVVWYDFEFDENIVKQIVAKDDVGVGEILYEAELANQSLGKRVGDIVEVNNYKYEIKQIIRQK